MRRREEIVKGRGGNDGGFTLIETIAVLVIIAIISALIIARGTGTDTAQLQAEVDTLKGHLRYAQALAMNANEGNVPTGGTVTVKWGIRVDVSSYTLIKDVDGDQSSPFNLPAESSATRSFAPINATGTGTVLFDEWGGPETPVPAIALGGQSIPITPETGFIP